MKSTGHFYIGVTDNLDRRQRCHYLKIKSAIELRWRKEEPEGDKLYTVFSKVICPLVDNWANLKKVIKDSYSISVKRICVTAEAISKRETDLIRRHKNNPLLLNSSLKSTYAANQTAKRIAAIGR